MLNIVSYFFLKLASYLQWERNIKEVANKSNFFCRLTQIQESVVEQQLKNGSIRTKIWHSKDVFL